MGRLIDGSIDGGMDACMNVCMYGLVGWFLFDFDFGFWFEW